MIIRSAQIDDLPHILEIENASFSTPWGKGDFYDLFSSDIAYLIVSVNNDNVITGYAGFWTILDEIHLGNIAVLPQFRKMGIGKKLMEYIILFAKNKDINGITLEVNSKNTAAIALYESLNFKTYGKRKNYYGENEDALIMWRYENGEHLSQT